MGPEEQRKTIDRARFARLSASYTCDRAALSRLDCQNRRGIQLPVQHERRAVAAARRSRPA
jgi:hypothetical protein